jgi:hypothetical protein
MPTVPPGRDPFGILLFKNIVEIVNRKEHLTNEGLQKVINLKASLNRGLSHNLSQIFPT